MAGEGQVTVDMVVVVVVVGVQFMAVKCSAVMSPPAAVVVVFTCPVVTVDVCPMDPKNSCLTAMEDSVPIDCTLSAAASALLPASGDTASTAGASCAPSGYRPISAVELYVILNRIAKPKTIEEKEAAEKAYEHFMRHDLAAALGQQPLIESFFPLSVLPRSAIEESRKRGKAAKKVQSGVSFASVAGGRAAEQQAPPRSERRLPTRNLKPPTNPQPETSAAGLPHCPTPTRVENGQAAPAAQTPVAKQCQPMFILMNKLAHGGPYPGREADEAAIFALCKIQTAAALPHTRQQVLGVPPRAPPVTSHLLAVPAAAASAGVAPLVSTTQEVDVPPVAPLAPETQEEPVAALAVATEMEDVDLPDANLAEATAESERRDTDPDAARAPRKRRAMTNDDSDTPSQTSDAARPRKKAPRASRTSTTESGTTIAGSSRSIAKQKPTKTTRRSTRPPAASRQPDEDGFVAPPRRHTARAAALQQPTPLPTANAFASASVDALDDGAAPPAPAQKKPFAAATKGGPSASTARPSAQAEGETQQPTAPSTASPVGVATPAPSQSARVAAPRRRRRRAGRATPAVAQRTAANTLPQQRTAPRAVPQPRSTADAPQQPSTSDRPQQAAPVVEAAPEAPTAPLAADAAELRSLLRSLKKENSPGCYEVNRTDLTGSQGGMSPSSRLLLLNAIAGLTGRDRRKYEKKLERAWKEPPILPKGDRTPPSARLIKAKSKKSPKRNKVKPGSPVKKRKTTSRKTVAARRPEVADAAGSAAPEPTAPANTKADRATCSGGQQGQVAAEQSACAVTASAPPEAAGRLRPEVNAQKHEAAEASARGRRKETDTAGAGSPPRGNAGAEEPRSVAEVCAEGSERCGSSAEIATQEIDDEGFQLARERTQPAT
ncbi:proteoglycan 4-like [Schistocerca cancellata]|uniref:proteoglycan 4-like n=1 Tax=Schistocerca cancellata TaxID=274614 RepID=UPI002118BBCF|nr:proteoglycan 4-like [Schistocerca cancellata]